MANPTQLYLPLLTHADEAVRRQASLVLLSTYGARGLTYLRRLLDAPEASVRAEARAALLAVAQASGLHVELQPFRGIYVRCLGELQVFVNGREVAPQDWAQSGGGRAGARKTQGLFAFLVHSGGRGASRAEIVAAVWSEPVGPSSLSRALGGVRELLAQLGSPELAAQALSVGRDHVTLSPASYHSDAALLERTLDLACQREQQEDLGAAAPLYHQVLELYDGPYMDAVPRASDWGRERRDLLANAFLLASERLAEHAYGQGNYRQCLALCRKALAVDPAADDLVSWLLRAYDELGLSVEADQIYRRYLVSAEVDPLREPEDPVVHTYSAMRHVRRLPSEPRETSAKGRLYR
ncbi:MAG TPA: bacterial transcriptional activator domain-containing protein [Chloroflexaceae bacterium]|nr:bacterial transcriptional activator domain-containing protein [Chloroflexaceae bacterium]